MSEWCPFLRAAGDERRCAASSEEELAFIPGGFLQRTCLTEEFGRCARYQAATGLAALDDTGQDEREFVVAPAPTRPPDVARWLAVAAGAAAVLAVGCIGVLAVLALLTGGFGLARTESAVYVEPSDTPTVVPTFTPTEVPPTPTLPPTDTPLPAVTDTPAVTATAVLTPTEEPSLPPEPSPTEAGPAPTARPRPTARPTNTPTMLPTRTRTPTVTPTPTALGCAGDERMAFVPAAPVVGEIVAIQVRSTRGHKDVSLMGPGTLRWDGVTREGATYVWNWSTVFEQAGTYGYTFKINSGALVCMADIPVTVGPPRYGLTLALVGSDHMDIGPGETAEIRMIMKNTSSVVESFDFGLVAVNLPGGWQAKYCLDGVGCWDYTVQSTPIENVEVNQELGLSIKLIAPLDAQPGSSASATLWVESRHGPREEKAGSASIPQQP
jgi:hypothetical protein